MVEVGQKYNRLTVISKPYKVEGCRRYVADVICICGSKKTVQEYLIRKGIIKSCGCLRKENTSKLKLSHGMSRNPTYITWINMKARCLDSNREEYFNYGGRGITYDPRWESFENFLEDMGERPEGMTLDRVDVNGPYTKDNCRWTDKYVQSHNRRKQNKSTSQYLGVSFCRMTGKWVSKLRYEGRNIIFERFDKEVEAALAYDEASFKVYGDRPNKHLLKGK